MSLAPWRSPLARALHRNRSQPYSRYLQLATVQPNGYPANRTVVFRGFLGETNQLQFVTDARSEKSGQIQHHAQAEACWYFTETREQFRIAGSLILVGSDREDTALQQARQAAWQALSDAARGQFAWPTPKAPRSDQEAFAPQALNPQEPLLHFCLLLLEPEQVDHLELRGEPQNRWLYQRDPQQGWSTQAVNP